MEVDHWGIEQEEQNQSPLASVLQYGTSTNPILKQASIIYAATTEVLTIEVARSASAPTAYFAAFLTAMQQKGKHSADTLAALCYLMARIYPLVPNSVLCLKAAESADLFVDILKRHAEIVYITKNLLFCLAKNLRALGANDMKALCSPAAVKMLRTLLVFSVDPRPKIRRDAQKNSSIFFRHMASTKQTLPKPVWEAVVTFVENELAGCSRKDCQIALHLCGLLKEVVQYLPTAAVAKIVAPLLQLAAEGNPYLVLQTFNVLSSLFHLGFPISRVLVTPGAEATALAGALGLSATDIDSRVSRDAEFVENVLVSISDLKPNHNDIAGSSAFANAFKTGFSALYLLSPAKALNRATAIFDLLAESFSAEKPQVAMSASNALRCIVKTLINKDSAVAALQDSQHVIHTIVKRVMDLFNIRLRPAWLQSLAVAQATVFACPTPASVALVKPLLLVVDGIHRTSQNKELQLSAEKVVGAALQSVGPEAVLSVLPLGLPVIHESLTVMQQLEHSRPWILPLLADNVKYTSLGFYANNLLPCADTLLQLAALALSSSPTRPTEARTVLTLAEQVWEALPAFANVPTDLAKVFKPFAKKLVEYMQNDDTAFAQPIVCKALRLLAAKNISIAEGRWNKGNDLGMHRITFEEEEGEDAPVGKAAGKEKKDNEDEVDENYEEDDEKDEKADEKDEEESEDNTCPISREEAQENVKVLGQVAKNILPLLFNIASSSAPEDRVAVLDAILAYTHVADGSVKAMLFKRALEKFVEATRALNDAYVKLEEQRSNNPKEIDENQDIFSVLNDRMTPEAITNLSDTAKVLTDILMSMAPGLDNTCLELLMRAVVTHFNSADAGMQKKAYQAVGHVMTVNNDVFKAFWKDTIRAITVASANVLAPAMKARLVCAMRIYSHIPNLLSESEVISTLPAVISEAILASKENNSKTRDAAFNLVVTLAKRVHSGSDGNPALLTEFLYMVIAGLAASTPRMKSGTITMLARLVFEFRGALAQDLIAELFTTILVMIQCNTRELIKAIMGFIKVAVMALDKSVLQPHVKNLLNAFSEWSPENKSRFKRKVRLIFTILTKKFGFEYIRTVTPTSDVRLVDYLRKQMQRSQNAKDANRKEKSTKESVEDEQVKLQLGMSFEEFLRMDDEEDDVPVNGKMSAADLLEAQLNQGGKKGKKSKADDQQVWIGENADFMDDAITKHISLDAPAAKRGVNMADVDEAAAAAMRKRAVPVTEGGKLDVTSLSKIMAREEEEVTRQMKKRAREEDPAVVRKRQREEKLKEREEAQAERKAKSIGKNYASERAGGDARKRGQKHDPYAYMPLDPRTLNKRKNSMAVQSATYAAAFNDKSTRPLGQKASRSQRHAMRKKGGSARPSDD